MIDQAATHGTAVVIDGEPGVGKTTLVNAAAEYAEAGNFRVLRTTGTTAESGEQYAALQLLLHPLREALAGLPAPQRIALEVAFGMADGTPPTPLMAGMAVLTALSDTAATAPLLVVVEDMHWVDPASMWALRMVARRISEDPIVILMTTREQLPEDRVDLEHFHLGPLSESDSTALLDDLSSPPRGGARQALLHLAQGNPLALVELTGPETGQEAAEAGAVSRRIERAFAGRFTELEQSARLAILAVALGDLTTVEEAARLANHAVGRYPSPSWIDDAISASLLVWTPRNGLSFRHPLVRSAIISVSLPSERAAILRTLAREHSGDPARSLWWRAELATGPDRPLSDELAQLAAAGLLTGNMALSARAMIRAAELTPPGDDRVARLIDAADYAGAIGRLSDAALLIHRAENDAADPVLLARAAWTRETLPTGNTALARGDINPALHAIAELLSSGANDLATTALLHLAAVAWDHTREAAPGTPMLEAVRALHLDKSDPRALLLAAVTEPIARGDEIIEGAVAFSGDSTDPDVAWWLGYALNLAGEFELSEAHLERAITGLRARGDLRILPQALLANSMSSFRSGRLGEARALAEEGLVLGRDLGDAGYESVVRCCIAWFDAIEGIAPDLDAIIAGSPAGAHMMRSSVMRATYQGAVGASALLAGNPSEALSALRRLADSDSDDYNPNFAIMTTPDLVDAAIMSGDRDHAWKHSAWLAELNIRWHAPVLSASSRYAKMLGTTLDDDLPEALAELRQMPLPVPYMQARALLRIGERLSRQGNTVDGREALLAALLIFEALPANSWANRSREMLRASGERLTQARPSDLRVLTPQELRVCALAGAGNTNRAIAEQLFLSPRTVGAHLYSSYRKLGITTRDQLAAIITGT